METRLNKFLTEANYCSRRQADRLIAEGQVLVNGRPAILGQKVTSADKVEARGELISARKPRQQHAYLAFYKPAGVICTTDPDAKDNIIDAVNYPQRIYPIGRLDVKSEGLIFLTNDGSIVNDILKAENKIEKEYWVEVSSPIEKDFLTHLAKGVYIDGRKTLPAQVQKQGKKAFTITIVEGKNRQIRKMCEILGYFVTKLVRIRIGNITLGRLKPGKYKSIDPATIGI
ncbi:MAG: hypothetical protein A3F54_00295 [Candidatus Kerfeldbacteria bacterium RIFCSPHIGHO2_12_FULL_48_17]|uniref:Pseudouridine synthase n=1 Tax=Candidatus Kerfeldbacteria bacterium RIFCSPHIGHO2_12_FULL_48_17 TaxID=1798542 RepID=A0A1G2B111_9BACT|nr:MAG: hypothetical protein A3F54_00295 [Candidatus Kerfeldbacteria bacterium RIFCSPHIGHO2_12_FULL_48_17]